MAENRPTDSTTLYAAWQDTPGFNAEDFRLDAAGIKIGNTSIAIPLSIQNTANLDYALQFMKVRSSTSLPIPAYAPFETATIETRDGVKTLVIPYNPAIPSKFFRSVVG